MLLVAVIAPAAEKPAPMLIAWHVELLPPVQFVNAAGPEVVNAVLKLTPWLEVPVPPLHPETVTVPSVMDDPNVTSPEVPVACVLGLDRNAVRAAPA